MLIVISDLHLTDGTTGGTIAPGAFQLLTDRVYDLAMRASWRSSGGYRPIERIDVVLLGDVLDIIRSNRWLQTRTRPWDDCQSEAVSATVSSIVDGILERNAECLATLNALSRQPWIALPPADQAGQPALEVMRAPVDVRVHYMVGDHDWFLHLPGPAYDEIRAKVVRTMGLANSPLAPFPHDPIECDELLHAMRRHRVFARHGDLFDPLSFTEDRDVSSLNDAITIELVNRFTQEIVHDLDGDLPEMVLAGLREVDNIRPQLLIPVWIEGLLERSEASPAVRKRVKHVWDRMADEFLSLEVVRNRDSWSPFDLMAGLEGALKFSRSVSIGWSERIGTWLHSLRGADSDSYLQHALTEPDFRNRRARHIVYGHTHFAESVPLEASYADGFTLNQMYFNAGTWRRTYRPTVGPATPREFIPTECINYLAFFENSERGGRTFEVWSGMLDAGMGQPTTRSPEPASRQTPAAAANAVHTAPSRPVRAPHFSPAIQPTRSSNHSGF